MTKNILVGVVVLLAAVAVAKPRLTEDQTGKRELHMANCPSAVVGASTKLEEIADGVVLTVTAHDEWARLEIRRRAQHQGEASLQPERGSIEHTGLGTGTGRFGFCPGMLEGTTVDADLLPDGARLTIHADRPGQIKRLQRTTRDRLQALEERHSPRS
jgi:TusA-related sulfurtransferase